MTDSNIKNTSPKKTAPSKSLNAAAKSFTFNPSATTWQPNYSTPAPPQIPTAPSLVTQPPPAVLSTKSLETTKTNQTHSPKKISPNIPTQAPKMSQIENNINKLVIDNENKVINEIKLEVGVGNLQEKSDQYNNDMNKKKDNKVENEEKNIEKNNISIDKDEDENVEVDVDYEEEDEEEEEEEIGDEDPREHINLVFIGHVDAGKSTLSGNILYLMDQVDKRTIERYEKEAKDRNRESWFLAFIMDTNEEERAKGKTVEVGRAHFETNKKRFTILDAPGHKNYVPNMIQGASQADVGILVISARKGEFETGFERGGQTREHAMLAKTLGVNKLIVVINKMDEAKWKEERFNECVNKLKPFLKNCGYAIKKDVTFIPVSGLTGENVKDKVINKDAIWYSKDQPALIPYLDELIITGRNPDGYLRVPVLDRYQDRGTVGLGKVESGILKTGEKIIIMPTKVEANITQVYINDKAVRTAKPGENVTFKISCNLDELQKGFVLCSKKNPCKSQIKTFLGQLALVDTLEHRPLFTAGYKAILHVHTITEECTATKIVAPIDKKTGKIIKKHITFIKQGDIAIIRFTVEQSIAIETFNDFPQLGRFTLRDEGKTIGIGKIIKLE